MFKKDNDPNSSHRKSVSGILKKSISTNKTNVASKSNAQTSFSNKNDVCSMNDSKAKINVEFESNDSTEVSSQSINDVNKEEMPTSTATEKCIILPSTSKQMSKLNLVINNLNQKPMDQSSDDDEQSLDSSSSQIFSNSGNANHPIIDSQSSALRINNNANSIQLSSSTDSEDFDFITDFNNITVSSTSLFCFIHIHL